MCVADRPLRTRLIRVDGDAVLKGVVTAVSTAVLLLLSAAFFDAPLTSVAAVASLIIFLSAFSFIRAGQAPVSPDASQARHGRRIGLTFCSESIECIDASASLCSSGSA